MYVHTYGEWWIEIFCEMIGGFIEREATVVTRKQKILGILMWVG